MSNRIEIRRSFLEWVRVFLEELIEEPLAQEHLPDEVDSARCILRDMNMDYPSTESKP